MCPPPPPPIFWVTNANTIPVPPLPSNLTKWIGPIQATTLADE